MKRDQRPKRKQRELILTGKGRPTKKTKGRIPEWPNGADCKSAGARLRWFESIFSHNEKPILPQAKSLFRHKNLPQIDLQGRVLCLKSFPGGKKAFRCKGPRGKRQWISEAKRANSSAGAAMDQRGCKATELILRKGQKFLRK